MFEAHLVSRETIMEFNDCNLISPLAFGEPCLRENFVGTTLCHSKTNDLHCTPCFKRFDTIGHQCIPDDLYRLILQPMLVDKILRRNDTTCCTVLEEVNLSSQ